ALLVAFVALAVIVNGPVLAAGGPGLARLATAPANPDGSVDGIATFGGVRPSASRLNSLRALGLRVQGFQNLPLALLRGPRAAIVQAVNQGLAADAYPNERLQF